VASTGCYQLFLPLRSPHPLRLHCQPGRPRTDSLVSSGGLRAGTEWRSVPGSSVLPGLCVCVCVCVRARDIPEFHVCSLSESMCPSEPTLQGRCSLRQGLHCRDFPARRAAAGGVPREGAMVISVLEARTCELLAGGESGSRPGPAQPRETLVRPPLAS
jgi:hypothetical protein